MSGLSRIGDRLCARPRLWGAAAAAALAVAAAASVSIAVSGGAPTAAQRHQFAAAGRAYGEGRVRDAAAFYEGLVRAGLASAEVHFNLGNARARDGRIGEAVLSYRRAWRLAPRDPDVGANLHLALQATGASEADLSGAELVLTKLSEREWAVAAACAWWAACLLLALAMLVRDRRRTLLRLAALPAAVALAAALGLWTWGGFERTPELVVLEETQNALAAPLASASPRFSLPEGAVVRAREHQGEWVRVSYGQLSGWIRRAACAPVLPGGPPA